MQLYELISGVKVNAVKGTLDIDIKGVNLDSRLIKPGQMFMAFKGTQTDGHAYIPKAIEAGAVAVMCEEMPEMCDDKVTYIQVDNTEQVIGDVATVFYGNPSRHLKLIGVTGTNGKTTIATELYNMFRKLGHKAGLISTVVNRVNDEKVPTEHTTPDPITLNALLASMVDAGCEYAFMEVSSHAVAQNRIGGLYFSGGIFTNRTRDHLDYHKTVENYLKAKKTFFDSIREMADFKARIIECHLEGMYLEINGQQVGVQFLGKFNVSNLLAVYGAACMLGQDPHDVLVALSTLRPVSGRFEAVHSPLGYTAIVDYAHTPDALANVLGAINGVVEGKGHIITVCGAGGNRDKGKRPIMAKEAVRQSDKVIITSDNPRFEEPQDIINDMLAGLDADDMLKVVSIADRKEAIRTACMIAQKGDVILVAGKGHEDYQEIKGVKHHFDDKEVLEEIFSAQQAQG